LSNTVITPLTTLDFGTLKGSITGFLQAQPQFTGYNFVGSDMSVLTDILAFNTTYYSFLINMLNAESHIDSAQLLGSVISEAKSLNYTPRSAAGATANLTINFTGPSATYLFQKGSTFSSIIKANNYVFAITDNLLVASGNGVFSANLSVSEGSYFSDAYAMSYAQNTRTFELRNSNVTQGGVDSSTISVVVYENNSMIATPFTFSTTTLGLNESSKVYFLQMNYKANYEIAFGDGAVGYRPADGATIVIDYLVTSGSKGNGATRFEPNFSFPGVANLNVVVNSGSQNGADFENIESIRFFAPRNFQVQERGIVPDDYTILLEEQFPEINAAIAYGGQDVFPPQYGKVFVSVDINGVDGLPTSLKSKYENFLKNKTMMTPVVVPAVFTYWSVTTNVFYNINITTLNPQTIKSLVLNQIATFNEDNLNNFGVTLYNVPFTTAINQTDPSIVTNDTDIKVIKLISPATLVQQQLTVDFGMSLYQGYMDSSSTQHPDANNHTISSSKFFYGADTVYIEDDGAGGLHYVKDLNNPINSVLPQSTFLTKVGDMNYDTGVLTFNSLYINSFDGPSIKIYAKPANRDITVPANTILTITSDEINVTATTVRV
jgi:hypothetical protein